MSSQKSFVSRALVLGTASCLALACADSEPVESSDTPSGDIEIFSWWVSGGEVDALNALLAVHHDRHPRTEVKNLAEDLAEEARTRLEQRMSDGLPPSTFQANIGEDLFKWVLYNGTDDADSKVEELNAIAERNGWFDTFPAPVIDALSYNGRLYGVPANIHRLNALFYNKKIFTEQGLTPPATRDELLGVSAELKDAGYTALCIGSEHWWTLQLLAFENVFPSVAGGSYYQNYWKGDETPDSEQVDATLDYLNALWPYFNTDANALSWTGGIDHMFDTESPCAMTVMGDWAKGYLESKGWQAGVDFEQIPFPGSNGTFVFTADTFPLPKGAPNRAGAIALLESIGSIEGQVAFNVVKGSIPVRTDVDANEFDTVAQSTMRDFASANLVLALSGMMPQGSFQDLGPAIKDMLGSTSKEGVLNVLANDYSALK